MSIGEAERLGAIVLCGGMSRRMGRPKASLTFGPETLLARVVRLAGSAVGPIVVVAAPDQELPPLPVRVAITRDAVAGRGPLEGLAAGLAALPATVEFAYAAATDAPFLAPAWIGRLHALIGDADLAIPLVGGHLEPLGALYRCEAVRPAIESLLEAGRLRAGSIAEAVRTRTVRPEELADIDPGLRTLLNLNTPDDYARALVEAGFEPPRDSGGG